MFCKIIAYDPDMTFSKETVTIIHNLERSSNLVKAIAEDLMFELLEGVPEEEFVTNWEGHEDDWYAACSYECYEVDLDLKDCEQYDITEEEWREETELWSDDDGRF